jgi:hypothetical protein
MVTDAAAATPAETLIDGPYFEDLHLGQRFDNSPGLTLTEGLAAAHQAIVGGRLPLALDRELSRRVIGEGRPPPRSQSRLGRRDRPVHHRDAYRGGELVLPGSRVPKGSQDRG